MPTLYLRDKDPHPAFTHDHHPWALSPACIGGDIVASSRARCSLRCSYMYDLSTLFVLYRDLMV